MPRPALSFAAISPRMPPSVRARATGWRIPMRKFALWLVFLLTLTLALPVVAQDDDD